MNDKHILIIIMISLMIGIPCIQAQQGQTLAKIRVDDNGNVEILDKKETNQIDIDSIKMQHQEIQLTQPNSNSLSEPLPDLYYYLESYTYTHPNLQVNVTIANKGDAVADSFIVMIKLSPNYYSTKFHILYYEMETDLHPSAYRTISVTSDLSDKCGNWSIKVYVDHFNNILESDETNNDGIIEPPLYVEEGCFSDLRCWGTIIDSLGPVIDFYAVSDEHGNCPFTFTHDINIYLSTDQDITSSDYLIQTWTAYSGVDHFAAYSTGPFVIPDHVPPGKYYLGAYVDMDNVVVELDETNNSCIFYGEHSNVPNKITVPGSPTTQPDLIVSSVSVTDEAGPGIAYQFSVKNQGSASTGEGFRNDIYLSPDQTITRSDHKIDEKHCSALGAGNTHNSGSIQTIVEGVPAGDYYLGVIADGSRNISESNESNNTGYDSSPKVNMPGGYEEPEEPLGNMISNWSFSDGMNDWTFVTLGGGSATSSIENGVFHAQITGGGSQLWEVRLLQDSLTIEYGKTHTINFQARADESRDTWATVGTGSEPYITYNSNWLFSLTTDWQTYTYTFTMGYSTNPNALITFNMGTSSADIYLDNISLVEEAEEPEEPEEPEQPEEPAGNMIDNWSFLDGKNDWEFGTMGTGSGSGTVENGVFHAQIQNGGSNTWDVNLHQFNLTIVNGHT